MWSFGKTWSELEKGGVSKEMADIGHRTVGQSKDNKIITGDFYDRWETLF